MTFTTIDQTVDDGSPIELFKFEEGGRAWRFTTRAVQVEHAGEVYLPAAITRGTIVRDAGSLGDPLQITLPDTSDIALELLAGLVMHQVAVQVLRLHLTDSSGEARTLFKGVTTGVSFSGASASISCGSQYALASRRQIATATFQAGCNLTWGSSRCGVNKETYRVNVTAVASDQVGRTLTLPALTSPVGHFNGGRVLLGNSERFIEKHAAGGVLTLNYPLGSLTSSAQTLAVYPDCNKNEADCAGRYSNLPNYLGWSRLPSVNPYNRSAFYLEEATTVAPPAGSIGDLPGVPGYQITLPPVAQRYERGSDPDAFEVAFVFTPTGYLLVRWTAKTYDMNLDTSVTETAAAGMWASPRPLPAWGDIDLRVDLTYPDPAPWGRLAEVSRVRTSTWMNPVAFASCSAVITNSTQGSTIGQVITQTLIATVRVRNHTTGMVIAQGDITFTIDAAPVQPEHG